MNTYRRPHLKVVIFLQYPYNYKYININYHTSFSKKFMKENG